MDGEEEAMRGNTPPGSSIFHTILVSAVSAAVFAFTIETYSGWRERQKENSEDQIALKKAEQRIAELETLVKASNGSPPRQLSGHYYR